MRYLLLTLVMVISIAAVPMKQEYVKAINENVAVYENRVRKVFEKALFVVRPDENLFVLKTTESHVNVRNEHNQTGWVERRLVTPVIVSRSLVYSGTQVEGYRGIFGPMNVFGHRDFEDGTIKLDRSFSDALRENIDKETIARMVR